MNELIPLMVIVPLMAALIISACSRFNKATKAFAFIVAICLPLIPLASNYGLHYFGGYEPILDNSGAAHRRFFLWDTPTSHIHHNGWIFLVSSKADNYQQNAANNGAGNSSTQTEGLAHQFPAYNNDKATCCLAK